MKTYRVIVQSSAQQDIEEAYLWLAERNEEAAVRWFNGIMGAVKTLKRFPERCSLAMESSFFDCEIRQMLYGKRQYKYRLLFTIKGDAVHILHVRHGARLPLGQPPSEEV